MEELKCFFLLLLSVIKHKICKHRGYNETREEQGKYLILLSLFTGHFHKLRNVGKIMEGKKKKWSCLPAPVLVPQVVYLPACFEGKATPESMAI